MITIEQLLESVDLDFEPRWVTKDKSGDIEIWSEKPKHTVPFWRATAPFSFVDNFGRLKLSEFDGKNWTECIYEVPRKTEEQDLEKLRPADSDLVHRVKLPRKTTVDIEKLGKLNVSGTNMTMNQNAVDTVVNTLNRVIDAVNKHADIIQQIGDWGARKGECLWCEDLTSVNLGETKCSFL